MDESQAGYHVPDIAAQRQAGPSFLVWWCLAALPLVFVPDLITMILNLVAANQPEISDTIVALVRSRGFITSVRVLALALQGLAQWLTLRPYLPRFQRWILVTILAGLTQILVYELVGLRGPGNLFGMIAHGAIQWLALRGRLHGAAIWIPATAIGLYLPPRATGWLFQSLFNLMPRNPTLGLLVAVVAIQGLAYGLVTGAAMCWLLRRNAAAASG